jgi:hypothetical protein
MPGTPSRTKLLSKINELLTGVHGAKPAAQQLLISGDVFPHQENHPGGQKTMKRTRLIPFFLLALPLIVACGSPPEPEEVARRTSKIVPQMIQQIIDAVEALEDLDQLQSAFEGLELAGILSEDETSPTFPEENPEQESDFDAQQVADFLEQHVFTQQNVESTDGDSVTFLMDGKRLCDQFGARTATCTLPPGGGEPLCVESTETDPECIDAIDELEIRITARLVGDEGVELRFSLGGHAALITLTLQPGKLEIELSLDSAKPTLSHVAQVANEPLPDLPQVFSGALRLSLSLNGPGDVSVVLAIPETVRVEGSTDEGQVKLDIEARDPLIAVHAVVATQSLELDLDWGATQLLLPARAVWEQAPGNLELLLQGLTATLKVAAGQPLQIDGIGLGGAPSWIKLNDQTLLELDLNAAVGGLFDLEITPEDGMPRCEVSPSFQIETQIDFTPALPYMDETPPDWMLGEQYRVSLVNSAGSPVVLPVEQTASFEGGLKVVAGTLTLQSTVNPHTVTVGEGSCLIYQDDLGPGEFPVLTHFQSVACP